MIEPVINAKELLSWYVDAGVDVALQDEPVDRFSQSNTVPGEIGSPQSTQHKMNQTGTASPSTKLQTARPTVEHAVPDSNAIAQAKALVSAAKSLDDLKKAIEGFEACNLKFTARSTVFSDGNPAAKIMIVGDAPKREEDALGLPFVGRAGQLLDKMLASIGLDRTQVYLSSIIPWRPPGNRLATPAEIEICRPFIERHIELAQPDILVVMGGAASGTLLKSKTGIMGLRGKWVESEIGDTTTPTLPMLHPDYLLRTPSHKRLAWNDLLALKARLSQK